MIKHFDDLSPESLLDRLRFEQKRDRRRMILNLLEAHGPAARVEAFRQLEDIAGGGDIAQDWYFPRNLICILNRIPPPEETNLDHEVALIARFLNPTQPAPVVREAMTPMKAYRSQHCSAMSNPDRDCDPDSNGAQISSIS